MAGQVAIMCSVIEVVRLGVNKGRSGSEEGSADRVGEEKHGQAGREARYWLSISDRLKSVESGECRARSAPISANSLPMIPE